MIVDTMNYKEIAEEFVRDYEEEIQKPLMTNFGLMKEIRRYVIKHVGSHQFHQFRPREINTKRRNKFTCLMWTPGKTDFKKEGCCLSLYMEFWRRDGMHTLTCDPLKPTSINFYTPHFFERYRERYLKNLSLPIHEVINHFQMNSIASASYPVIHPKYKDSFYATTNVGVLLGQYLYDDVFEYRTFLSFEMLKKDEALVSRLQLDDIYKNKYLERMFELYKK